MGGKGLSQEPMGSWLSLNFHFQIFCRHFDCVHFSFAFLFTIEAPGTIWKSKTKTKQKPKIYKDVDIDVGKYEEK